MFTGKEVAVLTSGAKYNGINGKLTLTTERIIFERTAGVFSKQTLTPVNLPLENIENVAVGGTFGKCLVITVKKGVESNFPVRLKFSVDNPLEWKDQIVTQVSAPCVPPMQPAVTRETIIKEVVMIPCKYCGGLMPNTSFLCPNCGARKTS
jgi:hypothetical protein